MKSVMFCAFAASASAFTFPRGNCAAPNRKSRALAEKEGTPDSTNFDRLKEEAANPFRTLRLFIYGAAGANAAIGGFTSLAQLAGTLGNAPSALPLNQVTQNLGVDFGVVAAAAGLYYLDSKGQKEQLEEYAGKDAEAKKKRATKLSQETMEEREVILQGLSIDVVVSGDMQRRSALVGEMQKNAKQSVVVVAGAPSVVREALLRAMILGEKFKSQNVLIVPVPIDDENRALSPSAPQPSEGRGKGFGKSALDDKAYVAKPSEAEGAAAAWGAYVDDELRAAAAQAGASTAELAAQGIVIVANREGKIVRRGLGAPAWDVVISEDLKNKQEKEKPKGAYISNGRF